MTGRPCFYKEPNGKVRRVRVVSERDGSYEVEWFDNATRIVKYRGLHKTSHGTPVRKTVPKSDCWFN